MVRLEEVEDEAFVEKPESSKDDILLADDDADYTDTGMYQSSTSIKLNQLAPHLHSLTCSAWFCLINPAPSYHPQHLYPSLALHLLTVPHRLLHLRRRAHNAHRTRRVPDRPHPGTKGHNSTTDTRETIFRPLLDLQRHQQSGQLWRKIPLGSLHERAVVGTAVRAGVPG